MPTPISRPVSPARGRARTPASAAPAAAVGTRAVRLARASALALTLSLLAGSLPSPPATVVANVFPGLLAQQCVFSQGYWRTHTAFWPRTTLVLGDPAFPSHVYPQPELLSILDSSTKGDASLILSGQLVAAKLNVAYGANGQVVAAALSRADTLLGAFRRRLPYGVKSNTPAGSDMVTTAKVLEDFNRGLVPGSCGATNTPPVANAGPDQRVSLGATATLDGSRSSDADGQLLTYAWSFVSIPAGSSAVLAGPTSVTPAFVTDRSGTYEVRLVVYDGSAFSQPSIVRVTTENARPVAAAGADQTVPVTARVQLDGSGSTDPDGDTLTYAWSLIERPAASSATLQNATAVNPTFVADTSGNFTVQLIVSDGALSSVADLVIISTSNSAPVADAGGDATGQNGGTVTLDGSGSTDVDGDALTYRWTLLTTPDGSAAALSGDTTVSPSFTIDVSGVYVVQLIVNDGTVDSAADTVTVTTMNSRPIANAGPDRSSQTGIVVELDGSGSTDVDGDSLSFEWSLTTLPSGSLAALSDPTAIKPALTPDLPGTYVAQLIVRDQSTGSDPDTVSVVVEAASPQNQAPIAEAGPPQTVSIGETVTLDGAASTDPDSDPLTYQWSLSAPAGSAAMLSNPDAVSPTFVADVAGTYVAQLIVNDGALNSTPDTVSISTENSIPVADAGEDRGVATGSTVQLDGSGSFDADGSPLTYAWSLTRPAGSNAVLSSAAIVNPTFVADVNGTYVAQLIVGDGVLTSLPDTAAIASGPGIDLALTFWRAPTVPPAGRAETWGVQLIAEGSTAPVDIDVSVPIPAGYSVRSATVTQGSYDVSTGIWTLLGLPGGAPYMTLDLVVRPTGPYDITAEIVQSSAFDPNTSNNRITALVTPNRNVDLSWNYFNFSPGTRAVGEEVAIVMDLSNSGPAVAENVVVDFKIPPGFTLRSFETAVGTYSPTTGLWTIGTFDSFARTLVRLQLNATGLIDLRAVATTTSPDSSAANNVLDIVRNNRAPTANAGADRNTSTHARVTLDGAASFDADGDPITFEWVLGPRPINSDGTLTGPATPAPSFTPDLPGAYVGTLVVRDSFGTTSLADAVTITAIETNRAPAFVSVPPVSGFTGQPYSYDANAIDSDAGDILQFSLPTTPQGMTVDAQSGLIAWTPQASQGGAHPVVLRVQDAAGRFALQSFTIQVSSPSNRAPVANDDDYSVRISESLSVPAPGVTGNDADESPLAARLVAPPDNGNVLLNADGSFTYTPNTLLEGELVLAENVNLATRMPGVVVSGGTCGGFSGAQCAFDDAVHTKWVSVGQPLEVLFPADVTVNQVTVVASREANDSKISAGLFELFAADGTKLHDSGTVAILGPSFDATLILPKVQGVRRVRFKPMASPTSLFSATLADLRVIGAGLIRRSVFDEPNLVQLLPATVRSSGVQGFNIAEALIDDSPANWFSPSNPGDFIEVTFPLDVNVRELVASNPDGRPDGFGTSNGMACRGTFTLLDANRGVLFDSGVVDEPSGFLSRSDTFTLAVPEVASVRHIRYTLSGCTLGFGLGFSEWRVIGSAPVSRPAFGLGEKFQALQGREAHSTPIVVNLTDDNGDGLINADDVPDIAVPLEAVGDQLAGEIKVISGADGSELFTAGGPNLVSPWSELAAGDIDADGKPEILAVSSAGNRLLAFEHDGTFKWQSSVNAMPSFALGGSTLTTGAISIANLDNAGPPEIIVGASVFDANGVLLGDGRTLQGTTGGLGLRSAISAVGDIDLDGVPELVAGPTAYRLSGGALTKVWQRTDRPDAYVALANLDDDPQAEIVGVANGSVYVLNHDGSDFQEWNAPTSAPLAIPGGGQGGAPLIVDVDGDGRPEIGVAGATSFVLFNRDGRVRWNAATSDRSSNATGAVAFDLNGDGETEIIYRDERFLRVYRGTDGVLLSKVPVGSATWAEEPVVADVDNDGHADIVVSSDFFQQSSEDTGILVFQDVANKWKRTRRIWNQHAYHVTNVNEDATIPVAESPHWLIGGLNAFRTNAFVAGESADETDRFTYVVSDGVLESNEATVRVALRTPNAQPAFTSSGIETAAPAVLYTYAAQAVDPDAGDLLTFSLPAAPPGMSIDPSSGLIAWTPTDGQLGAHEVVVKVADLRGLFALQRYTLEVDAPIAVPSVIGQPEQSGAAAIANAGLALGAVTRRASASVVAGAILDQTPSGGSSAAAGTPVSIVVSLGPPPAGVVPAVIGLTQPVAQADVAAAGFVTSIASQSNATVAAGIVLIQNPAAGTTAPSGSTVALVVSSGPPPGELDLDGDGFTGNQGDCNDTNAAINPSAFDAPGDGIDQNCNGVDSIAGDATPPLAVLLAPADLAEITMPTDIVGTATDANFLRYTVTLAEIDSTTVSTIGVAASAVTSGVVGRLDPTLLENGLYRVRLIAEDANGQTAVDERVYRVTGDMKVGVTRVSFDDLRVPVSGIPITIVRHYDSRVKASRDFGVGWTLEVKAGRYRHNRLPGDGWIIRDQPFLGGDLPCIGGSLETKSHLTEIRLSDREAYTFALQVTNNSLGVTGACEGVASFRFIDGPLPGATLDILDDTGVIYLRGGADELLDMDEWLDGALRVYDPQRVRLRTIDGRAIELERRSGVTDVSDANGNALTLSPAGIVHSSGRSIAFVRDESNRITSITDPRGHELRYEYDVAGDLIAFVDQAANTTTFTYDDAHNLVEIRDPLGNRGLQAEYDADGRLIATIDGRGARIAFTHDLAAREEVVVNARGHVTRATYDERGHVDREEKPVTIEGALVIATSTFEHDANGNPTVEVDPDDVRTETSYDADNPTRQIVDPTGVALTTAISYGARSRPSTYANPAGETITLGYDARGNLTRWTEPDGGVLNLTRDDRGQTTGSVDMAGLRTATSRSVEGHVLSEEQRDPSGRLLARTDYSYDANGNRLTATESRTVGGALERMTTGYTYDALNRLVAVRDPAGNVSRVEFDALGLQAAQVDSSGRRTTFTYDEAGSPSRTDYPDGTFESTEYDAAGNAVRLVDREGRMTTVEFDELNRAVRTNLPDGTSLRTIYTAAGRTAARIDAAGNRTDYVHDAAGRVVRTIMPPVVDARSGTTSQPEAMRDLDEVGRTLTETDPNGNRTTHVYDAAGRRTRTTAPDGTTREQQYDTAGRRMAAIDESGRRTSFEHDVRGRLTAVVDPAGGRTTYAYDEAGNRLTETDPLGRVTRHDYDALHRRVRTTLPGGEAETLTYDEAGNVIVHVDFIGAVTTIDYDTMNRPVRRRTADGTEVRFTYTPSGQRATAVDARGTTTYRYDTNNRLASVTHPAGEVVEYSHDSAGRLKRTAGPGGASEYEYDAMGRLLQVTDASGTTRYGYDPASNVVETMAPNGVTSRAVYDVRHRLREIRHTANGTTLAAYGYDLLPTGQRSRVTEADGSTEEYTYDALNRLVLETRSGTNPRSVSYDYDAVGNRTRMVRNGVTVAYTHDVNNRTLTAGGTTYTYDANGSRLTQATAGALRTFTWDLNRRLVGVTDSSGIRRFGYDVDGNRVEREAGGQLARFLIDSNNPTGFAQVLEEHDAAGGVKARYTLGLTRLAMSRAGTASFYQGDALGSTRVLTDASGAVTDAYVYEAFGALTSAPAATENTFRFAGEEQDTEAGLYYLRARWMDPGTGRFVSRDPFPGYPERPISMHKYQYGDLDPVNNRDPLGLMTLVDLAQAQAIYGNLVRMSVGVLRLYNVVDSVSDILAAVQVVGSMLGGGGITGLLSAPPGVPLDAITNFNPAIQRLDAEEAANVLQANLGRVWAESRGHWLTYLAAEGRQVEAFLFYLPSLLPHPSIPISIPGLRFGVGRRHISLKAVLGGCGTNRVIGAGLQINASMATFDQLKQIWRMSYNPYGVGLPVDAMGCGQPTLEIWRDRPNFEYMFHVLKPR